ncbi:MAG TPA: hypothetical protein PLD20_28135 [Blastocatellia bacterium]|nr:hypothetical protein [Blastocatellia bacterium]HMX30375.1 hypothetical protein [Blastocatellia bacterium]HMY72441.1 hypothetical protein [Blastocatellia bacterium]HMZ21834.1 hypothetical protein [Blastocatellia bacterium]HNG30015.1 hypothetical protein [Blastocatellia bacterium]
MNLPTQSKRKQNRRSQREEQGYALVALVGIMMFALILTTAAAPMVQKESQREREEEMLWRGSQIARAIQAYGPLGINGKPLTDLKELVEGREQPGAAGGTKIGRVRFLRASALCDPMVPCKDGSNWRMVRANDALIKDFYDLLMAKQSSLPLGSPERMQLEIALNSLRPFVAGAVSNVPGQASSMQLGGSFNNGNSGNGQQSDNSDSSIGPKTRPILGVSSEKNGTMFRNYYGVDEYKRALFFPGVPVQAGGFVLQAGSDGATAQAPINERCEDGSLRINGQCGFGVIKDGRCPPSKRGPDGSCVP